MANVQQGEIALNNSTVIVVTNETMAVTSIIINNLTTPYTFTLYRVSVLDIKNPVPMYQFTLDAGDTIRDSKTYILDKGDYLILETDVAGTTFYVTTV
jgi:hypothetical protein